MKKSHKLRALALSATLSLTVAGAAITPSVGVADPATVLLGTLIGAAGATGFYNNNPQRVMLPAKHVAPRNVSYTPAGKIARVVQFELAPVIPDDLTRLYKNHGVTVTYLPAAK